jgi:hypothetical protein
MAKPTMHCWRHIRSVVRPRTVIDAGELCASHALRPGLCADAASASDAAAKATYPAFRDEMVMTLLAVADSHPWGARSQELLAGPDPATVAILPRLVSTCDTGRHVHRLAALAPDDAPLRCTLLRESNLSAQSRATARLGCPAVHARQQKLRVPQARQTRCAGVARGGHQD